MSQQPINHSPDLKRLRNEGYDLEIHSGFLLVKDVPYVNASKAVKRGTLVVKLMLAGDVTTRPDNHVAYFAGEYPCREDGREIEQIKHQSYRQALADGVMVDHSFSAKPTPAGNYEDYYAKITTYDTILSGPAKMIDPKVTAKTFPVIEPEKEDKESVFNYIDTASSRAEIDLVSQKLALGKIAIVGLGGTGSYVLDLVAKTPVKEIHLFDGDEFLTHNAFRSPGAPSIDELKAKPTKSAYLKNLYSKMHRGIVDHEAYVSKENVELLQYMTFVFLCVDNGMAKKLIVETLEKVNIPFIEVGMGIYRVEDSLAGTLRVTTSTPNQRESARARIPFSDGDGHNEYALNIQIADLNALNAALAVVKWKKILGFYKDLDQESYSTYDTDGNKLINEGHL